MVHDKLISYQIHKTIPDHYILYIDTILYREAKYHGKNVEFIILVEKNKGWNINILDAKIKGVIPEDQIALFPLQTNDALNTNINLSPAEFTGPSFSSRLENVSTPEYSTKTLTELTSNEVQKIKNAFM